MFDYEELKNYIYGKGYTMTTIAPLVNVSPTYLTQRIKYGKKFSNELIYNFIILLDINACDYDRLFFKKRKSTNGNIL